MAMVDLDEVCLGTEGNVRLERRTCGRMRYEKECPVVCNIAF